MAHYDSKAVRKENFQFRHWYRLPLLKVTVLPDSTLSTFPTTKAEAVYKKFAGTKGMISLRHSQGTVLSIRLSRLPTPGAWVSMIQSPAVHLTLSLGTKNFGRGSG